MENIKNSDNANKFEGYTDSFVAFLDILGFKNYVYKNSFQYVDDLFKDIFRFADLLLKYPSKYFTKEMLDTVTVNSISDSIVVSVPKSTERSLEILLLSVNTIAINILREYKLLCRGGIYEGYFHSDENIAFGPALVQAYLLQENVAVNPRIIFPRHVFDVYESICSNKTMLNDLWDLMKLEADDEFFIADYIGYAIRRCSGDVSNGNMTTKYAYSLFHYIVNFIEDELACGLDKRVRDKYIYFRDYYNITLKQLKQEFIIPFKCESIFANDKDRD